MKLVFETCRPRKDVLTGELRKVKAPVFHHCCQTPRPSSPFEEDAWVCWQTGSVPQAGAGATRVAGCRPPSALPPRAHGFGSDSHLKYFAGIETPDPLRP